MAWIWMDMDFVDMAWLVGAVASRMAFPKQLSYDYVILIEDHSNLFNFNHA